MSEMWIERLVQNDTGQWVWQPQREVFDTEHDFSVNEENLAYELCRMAQLLVRYGTIAAEQEANLARKDEYAKLVYAQVSGAYRSQLEAKGERPTADRLKELATVDPLYQAALSALHILRADSVKADHWYRSAVKKADLLQALMYRQNAEIKRMPG